MSDKPTRTFRAGKIKLARWESTNDKGHKKVSFTLDKHYKNNETGNWDKTNTFFRDDLANIQRILIAEAADSVKTEAPGGSAMSNNDNNIPDEVPF